jgi:hypothetical protein
LVAERSEGNDEKSKNEAQLKHSADQLRVMAEKVFSLVNQLTKAVCVSHMLITT